MKKILFYLCILCVSIGATCSIAGAQDDAEMKTIEVNYYPMHKFFGDYDISVYLDNKHIATMKYGEVLQKDYKLAEGVHKVKFIKSGSEEVKRIIKFVVKKDKRYYNFNVYTPKADQICASGNKSDTEILMMENHPKVLDDNSTAWAAWGRYANRKICLDSDNYSSEPLIEGNYIADVTSSYYGMIMGIHFYPKKIDGFDSVVHDVDSAVKFLRGYINKDKLEWYYRDAESYKVCGQDRSS